MLRLLEQQISICYITRQTSQLTLGHMAHKSVILWLPGQTELVLGLHDTQHLYLGATQFMIFRHSSTNTDATAGCGGEATAGMWRLWRRAEDVIIISQGLGHLGDMEIHGIMNIHGNLYVSMNIYGHQWISMQIH